MINETLPATYRENENDELITARTIQLGLFPKKKHFKRMFSNHFILDIPLNIVSGDFYWVGEKYGLKYLVVGDATGHGTSAALIFVLAINLFEYTIMNKGIKKNYKILKEVDKKFIESFKSYEEDTYDNPWIDLSIICIDEKKQKLFFTSANRKLLFINHKNEPMIYKGNNFPIGGWQIKKDRSFNTQIIDYQKGNKLYLGSDGFQDQIGGPKQKKYKSKRLHQLLFEHSNKSFSEQINILKEEFNAWKGNSNQTDDVCIVGIELT